MWAEQKVRYLFLGGSSFVAEYLLFVGLAYAGASVFAANSLSFLVGMVISFVLHRHWSFRGDHQFGKKRQAAGYISLALINLVLTNIVIGILVLVMPSVAAKMVTMIAMVSWNYLILDKLIFRRRAAPYPEL
jgi:putative flippase GtrA